MESTPVDLSGRVPPWPATSRRHWQSCLRRVDAAVWSQTPPPYGHPRLRAALGRELGCDAEEVVVTTGVRAAAQMQARACDFVVVERPTFHGLVAAVRAVGVRTVLAPWGEELLDAPGAAGARRALCWVTSPLRNPDGRTVDPAFAAALGHLASAGHTPVVNETYRLGRLTAAPVVPGAVYVGSLAKVAGGGARLGWVRGRRAVESLGGLGLLWSHPPLAWQEAWATFLDEGGLRPLAEVFCRRPARAASAFAAALPAPIRPPVPPEAPYLLLPVRGNGERAAVAKLAEAGVVGGRGRDFHTRTAAVRLAFTGVGAREARRAAAACTSLANLFARTVPDGRR